MDRHDAGMETPAGTSGLKVERRWGERTQGLLPGPPGKAFSLSPFPEVLATAFPVVSLSSL